MTTCQADQLTDNITRLTAVVADLEGKIALGANCSAARRSVLAVGGFTQAAAAPAVSGSTATPPIGTSSKSFAELRAMFEKC